MQRNGRVDEFLAEFAETLERAFLVMSGQPGIAHYIGGQDGSELSGRFHGPHVRPGAACQPVPVSEIGLAESTSGPTADFKRSRVRFTPQSRHRQFATTCLLCQKRTLVRFAR